MSNYQQQMSRHDRAGRAHVGNCRVEAPAADKAQGCRQLACLTLSPTTRPGGIAILPGHLSFNCSRRRPVGEHRRRRLLPPALRQRPVHLFLQGGVIGRTFNSCAPLSRAQALRVQSCRPKPMTEPLHLKHYSSSPVADAQQLSERPIHAVGPFTQGLGNV